MFQGPKRVRETGPESGFMLMLLFCFQSGQREDLCNQWVTKRAVHIKDL